jgi:uncharacterized membrane protein
MACGFSVSLLRRRCDMHIFYSSLVAAFGAMLCWGFGDFLIQRTTRKIGDIEALAWIGIIGSIGLVPFIWRDLRLLVDTADLSILLGLGVITFIVAIANFEALRRGKLSVVDILTEFELPVTVILGISFLGESLSMLQVFLIFIVFIGILLMAVDPAEFRGKRGVLFERGALLALAAAVGFGLINFLTAVGAKNVTPLLAIWFPWITFTLICFGWMLYKGSLGSLWRHAARYPKLILLMGIFDTLAWVFFALAVAQEELAITIAITESYPVISLLLGVFVNRERLSKLQVAGAVLSLGASAIAAFTLW